jgi:hypothetical protein
MEDESSRAIQVDVMNQLETEGGSMKSPPLAAHTRWVSTSVEPTLTTRSIFEQVALPVLCSFSVLMMVSAVVLKSAVVGVWGFAILALTSAYHFYRSCRPEVTPDDIRHFDQFQNPTAHLVKIQVQVDGVLTGQDLGVLWPESGRLMFCGRESSFAINPADVFRIHQTPKAPFLEARYAPLSEARGSVVFTIPGKRVLLGISLPKGAPGPRAGRTGHDLFYKELLLASKFVTSEPSEFPPVGLQPRFFDRQLSATCSYLPLLLVVGPAVAVQLVVNLLGAKFEAIGVEGFINIALTLFMLNWFELTVGRAIYRICGASKRRRMRRSGGVPAGA